MRETRLSEVLPFVTADRRNRRRPEVRRKGAGTDQKNGAVGPTINETGFIAVEAVKDDDEGDPGVVFGYQNQNQTKSALVPTPELPISLLSSSADGRLNPHGAHRRTPLPTAEPKPLTRYRSHVVRCLADQDSSSPQNTIAHVLNYGTYYGPTNPKMTR
ncbi:hypothetical protein LXL04_002817 [Taraxacum kok-saghyz]